MQSMILALCNMNLECIDVGGYVIHECCQIARGVFNLYTLPILRILNNNRLCSD